MAMVRVFMDKTFKVRVVDPSGDVAFEEISINELLNEFEFSYINQMKSIHTQERRDAIIAGLQYTQDPEGQALLAQEYMKTLELEFMTVDEKKKVIDDQFEIEQYKLEKQQALQGQQPQQPQQVP